MTTLHDLQQRTILIRYQFRVKKNPHIDPREKFDAYAEQPTPIVSGMPTPMPRNSLIRSQPEHDSANHTMNTDEQVGAAYVTPRQSATYAQATQLTTPHWPTPHSLYHSTTPMETSVVQQPMVTTTIASPKPIIATPKLSAELANTDTSKGAIPKNVQFKASPSRRAQFMNQWRTTKTQDTTSAEENDEWDISQMLSDMYLTPQGQNAIASVASRYPVSSIATWQHYEEAHANKPRQLTQSALLNALEYAMPSMPTTTTVTFSQATTTRNATTPMSTRPQLTTCTSAMSAPVVSTRASAQLSAHTSTHPQSIPLQRPIPTASINSTRPVSIEPTYPQYGQLLDGLATQPFPYRWPRTENNVQPEQSHNTSRQDHQPPARLPLPNNEQIRPIDNATVPQDNCNREDRRTKTRRQQRPDRQRREPRPSSPSPSPSESCADNRRSNRDDRECRRRENRSESDQRDRRRGCNEFAPPITTNNGNYNQRQHVKTVPVNQWRISFSGDVSSLNKHDVNIYKFLEQVNLFRRASRITEEELLDQIIHLLAGNARDWYQTAYMRIRTWRQFADELRKKFLPADYNYDLVAQANRRKQGKTESVSAFINAMELIFHSMSEPMAENHRLYMVRSNLLPHFTDLVAATNPQTIAEVENVCKRLEGARRQQRANAQPPATSRPFRPRFGNVNAAAEIDEAPSGDEEALESNSDDDENHCAALKKSDGRPKKIAKPVRRRKGGSRSSAVAAI